MLINPKKYLLKAQKERWALGAFNTSDIEITQAILEAANKLRAPVIIQTSEKAINYAGLQNIYDVVKNETEKLKIPVAIHLDHGSNIEIVKKCLKVGYKSVMIDGSKLEYDKNIELTKKAVQLAKKYDAQVEGEIGSVPYSSCHSERSEESRRDPSASFHFAQDDIYKTDPETAKKFVELTGVDSLAVAFGNVHGIPEAEEKLDFELLKNIAKDIQIPLVFHGASSTPIPDMKKAISLGMAKVNIDTDIRVAFSGSIKKFQQKHPNVYDPREIMESAKDAVKKVVIEKIKLFGSDNKI